MIFLGPCLGLQAMPLHARVVRPIRVRNEVKCSASADRSRWQGLLSPIPDIPKARVRSASDASVLRRKGRLKEQVIQRRVFTSWGRSLAPSAADAATGAVCTGASSLSDGLCSIYAGNDCRISSSSS